MSEPYVLPFAGVGRQDVGVAGGKGASLGELCRAGIRVPPGFVVTTAAFRDVAERLPDGGARAVEKRIAALDPDDHTTVAAVTASVRDLFTSAPLPQPLETAIRDGYAQLSERGLLDRHQGEAGPSPLPVAVRSSATSEDSADASFAGLQDTFLWVRGADDIVEHVRCCWASLYSVESVTYRLRRKLPEEGLAIAVVVQQMVDARCSGVMFTRSPLTGDRSVIVLEASWGLGSAVVGGEVTPDSWVVNKVTGEVLRRTISRKLHRHVADPSGRGVRVEDVPEGLQESPALDDAALRKLVAVGRAVERHYGAPQDIEWAWAAGDDQPFLLQSRPETVWSTRPAPPIATAAANPFDHVLALLSKPGARPGGEAPR